MGDGESHCCHFGILYVSFLFFLKMLKIRFLLFFIGHPSSTDHTQTRKTASVSTLFCLPDNDVSLFLHSSNILPPPISFPLPHSSSVAISGAGADKKMAPDSPQLC